MARHHTSFQRIAMGLALASSCIVSVPSFAQTQDQEARLRKIEGELRAVQRTVFPGGDGRFFTPEVDSSAAGTPAPTPSTTTTAVSDMLIRLDAIEAQLARITAHEEENANTLADLKARLAALELADTDAINPQVPVAGGTPAAFTPTPTPTPTSTSTPTSSATRPAASAPVASAPPPARVAAVSAIAKPDTGDVGGDEYTYGFRLWEAKFYPESQQQLRKYVEAYPRHAQISFGRNLLGRAFLDGGQPREAATWFLQNYQADKNGARAGDSLLYLAEAMVALKDNNRACIALAEFGETYPALASGRLKQQYDRTRASVACN